jgi:hypothetical protein
MKKPVNNKTLVLIISSVLVLVLVMVSIYIIKLLYLKNSGDNSMVTTGTVGLSAEPDHAGWKPLFNGINLDGWEIPNFGPQGEVYVSNSEIILNYGEGCTGITWNKDFPSINYEISLEAMRVKGHDFFCGLTFPVFEEHCTLITGGWVGSIVGISNIDEQDASENYTRNWINFENNKWYHISIKVDSEFLRCFIDKNEIIVVPVKDHKFSVRSEVLLSRPLGICSWNTTAALRNIKFREI